MELQININPVCRNRRVQFIQLKPLQRMCKYLMHSKRWEWCQQFCDVKQCVLHTVRQCCPLTFVREAVSHWILQ